MKRLSIILIIFAVLAFRFCSAAPAVLLGDSIAAGWHMSGFDNAAVSGSTSSDVLSHWNANSLHQYPVIVVIVGTNDIFYGASDATYWANIEALVTDAMTNRQKVILCSLLPVYGAMIATHDPARIIAFNDWLQTFAAESGAVYADFYDAMVDEDGYLKTELSADGLHPNAAGYAVMFDVLINAGKA